MGGIFRRKPARQRLIDVRDVIRASTPAEHAEKADAYFSGARENLTLLRKPYASVEESRALLTGVSVLLAGLDLFPGVRLLDFGAGTCWSSLIFAQLGCQVVATDVSGIALEVGAGVKASNPLTRDLPVDFRKFDGVRLPLEDASVDRIVCIDCFHHVHDQFTMLREFFRVLAPGGIIAFHEAGPHHSRSSQSQYEMANFGVIENDIHLEQIVQWSRTIGFGKAKAAYFTPNPTLLEPNVFEKWRRGKITGSQSRRFMLANNSDFENLRVFFLSKDGSEEQTYDSRRRLSLDATISVKVRHLADGFLEATVHLQNTGGATWLASGSSVGAVNLGVHLRDSAHRNLNFDYAHLPFSTRSIKPGEKLVEKIVLAEPQQKSNYVLVFDLVAEGVSWFETLRSIPAIVRSDQIS